MDRLDAYFAGRAVPLISDEEAADDGTAHWQHPRGFSR